MVNPYMDLLKSKLLIQRTNWIIPFPVMGFSYFPGLVITMTVKFQVYYPVIQTWITELTKLVIYKILTRNEVNPYLDL